MEAHASDISRPLPEAVQQLFWEYDARRLTWAADRAFIIERVLAKGGWTAITWLRKQAGDEALHDWIMEYEGAALSPRQLWFWQLVLNLPAERVDAWVAARRASIWEKRSAP